MKKFNNAAMIISMGLVMIFCGREKTPIYDRTTSDSVVINMKNNTVDNKLDSVGFLVFIGNQKLQDVYDLASLKRRSTAGDSILDTQLNNYFWNEDSISITRLNHSLDSLDVSYAIIDKLTLLPKDQIESDSAGLMNYDVYYFDKDKKYLQKESKSVSYILQKKKQKLNNQFSFYFYDLGEKPIKEEGVTQ